MKFFNLKLTVINIYNSTLMNLSHSFQNFSIVARKIIAKENLMLSSQRNKIGLGMKKALKNPHILGEPYLKMKNLISITVTKKLKIKRLNQKR